MLRDKVVHLLRKKRPSYKKKVPPQTKIDLHLNGQWHLKEVFPPQLLQDFFVKNIGKLYAYDLLAMLLEFYWLTLKMKETLINFQKFSQPAPYLDPPFINL